jgi:hypothetical protein
MRSACIVINSVVMRFHLTEYILTANIAKMQKEEIKRSKDKENRLVTLVNSKCIILLFPLSHSTDLDQDYQSFYFSR